MRRKKKKNPARKYPPEDCTALFLNQVLRRSRAEVLGGSCTDEVLGGSHGKPRGDAPSGPRAEVHHSSPTGLDADEAGVNAGGGVGNDVGGDVEGKAFGSDVTTGPDADDGGLDADEGSVSDCNAAGAAAGDDVGARMQASTTAMGDGAGSNDGRGGPGPGTAACTPAAAAVAAAAAAVAALVDADFGFESRRRTRAWIAAVENGCE